MSRYPEAQDESDLLSRYYAGEVEAFNEICRMYFGRIAGLARRAGVPHADAQDVANEVLLRVMLTKGRGKKFESAKGDVRGWIYTIASNLIVDWFRRNKRWTEITSIDETHSSIENKVPSVELDPLGALNVKEKHAIFERCFARLPELDRLIMLLHYVTDHAYKEIAELLGISEQMVTNHLYQAREALKMCVQKYQAGNAQGAAQ